MIWIILGEGSSLHEQATIRYDTAFMRIPKLDMGEYCKHGVPGETDEQKLTLLPPVFSTREATVKVSGSTGARN